MCGVAGIYSFTHPLQESALMDMCEMMRSRGPDERGTFLNSSGKIGLGHRRLAVIDLSDGGGQPMHKHGVVVVYNGEIYNFKEIRNELELKGIIFTSESDTEVLLESWIHWGKDCVNKFRGMFAFAVFDTESEELVLCRDRVGVKPLYYYFDGEVFIFASELKAIVSYPEVKKLLDLDAVALFVQLGYIPAPKSIYKNTFKLEPGYFLTVSKNKEIKKEKYWDFIDLYKYNDIPLVNEKEMEVQLETVLSEAFQLRMVADVPVGVFLSGGVDSSLVAALLQKQNSRKLKTFTIGFEDETYDEAKYARKVAEHLGTEHYEIILKSNDVKEIIPLLCEIYDEPFSDPSSIPTYFVSKFARERVTVALSADGGDELFGGYKRYPIVINTYEKAVKSFILRLINPLFKLNLFRNILRRYGKGRLLLGSGDLAKTYANFRNYFTDEEVIRLLLNKPSEGFADKYWGDFNKTEDLDTLARLQIVDSKTYLPDSILTKVDRASMAVSLEAREPFLDPKLMKYAASLPSSFKYYDGQGKYILKKILRKHLPAALIARPKQGFGIPLDTWMKRDLNYLLDKYLNESRLREEGIFDPEVVEREKRRFLSGKSHYRRLWNIIIFQMWKERWNT